MNGHHIVFSSEGLLVMFSIVLYSSKIDQNYQHRCTSITQKISVSLGWKCVILIVFLFPCSFQQTWQKSTIHECSQFYFYSPNHSQLKVNNFTFINLMHLITWMTLHIYNFWCKLSYLVCTPFVMKSKCFLWVPWTKADIWGDITARFWNLSPKQYLGIGVPIVVNSVNFENLCEWFYHNLII
jgi:hypothetical protein